MLVYMVYDKKSGKIVHVHRAVDSAGHSCTCSEDEVIQTLPPHIEANAVGIVSTEMAQVPSGRQVAFSVDVKTRSLIETPVSKASTQGKK